MGNCSTCKHLRESVEECLLDEDGDCLGYEEDPNAETLCDGCYEAIVEGGRLCPPCAESEARTEHDQRELTALRARVAELERECAQMSEEFGLPPTIRPAEGEIRRFMAERKESRARVAELETALAALLDAAERQAAGFPLEAEAWFAVRDFARARLQEKKEAKRE